MTKAGQKKHLFADWRDFGREYVIVVLGVLTALIAQEWAQSLEWRHKVDAAVADMDQELANGNGPQAYVRLSIHRCLGDRLSDLREAVNRGDRATVRREIGGIDLPLRNWNSHARETANNSDIATHVPPETMYGYRIVYSLIGELDQVHLKELDDLAELRSLPASGGALGQDEKRDILAAIEKLSIDNDRMKRASAFTLRHMRDLGLGISRIQLTRTFADVPVYRGCLARNIKPLIDDSPSTPPPPGRSLREAR